MEGRASSIFKRKAKPLAQIFREARGGLSLREFVNQLDGKVTYSTLAKIERGEVNTPTDDVLEAVAPYTKPYKSVTELKVIAALGGAAMPPHQTYKNGTHRTLSYEQILELAQSLPNADRVRLIKALVEDLGRP